MPGQTTSPTPKPTMTKIAALTGGTGFIGKRIAEQLIQDGWQVRALVRSEWPGPVPTGLTIVKGSLGDQPRLEHLVEGASAVVHCAGAVRARSPQEFLRINADGAGQLAKAAAASQTQPLFLHISSLAARVPEISHYAASKREGEQKVAANIGNLRWFALRPPAVYGPGDQATLSIFRHINRGIAPVLGAADARVSLIFVDDLAAAVAAALANPPATGSIFEISDGAVGGYSWKRIGAAAAHSLGSSIFYLRVPKLILQIAAVANVGAGLLSGGVPIMTLGKVRELYHPDWACRDNLLTTGTEWRPKVEIDEGFVRTLAWYREQGWV